MRQNLVGANLDFPPDDSLRVVCYVDIFLIYHTHLVSKQVSLLKLPNNEAPFLWLQSHSNVKAKKLAHAIPCSYKALKRYVLCSFGVPLHVP